MRYPEGSGGIMSGEQAGSLKTEGMLLVTYGQLAGSQGLRRSATLEAARLYPAVPPCLPGRRGPNGKVANDPRPSPRGPGPIGS
jgi:hypothetical protein